MVTIAKTITKDDLIDKVIKALHLSAYDKDGVTIWVDDVQNYMRIGGVNEKVINSTAAIGATALGVNDARFFSSGQVEYSSAFKERVTQLSFVKDFEIEEAQADG